MDLPRPLRPALTTQAIFGGLRSINHYWRSEVVMGLLKTGVRICFFRSELDEIPKSFKVFTKTLMIYFWISTILKALIILPHLAVIQTVYEIGLTFVFVGILLLLFHKSAQFLQTLTALLTCESIVAFCTMPVTLWLSVSSSDVILIPFYII